MLNKLLKSVSIFAGTLIMVTSAFAGVKEGAFTLSPFVGGYTFDGVQKLKTNVVGGLMAGYNITRHWELGGIFFYVPVDSLSSTTNSTDAFGAGGDLIYNFMPDNRFVPYLTIGGGWMRINSNNGSVGHLIAKNDDATVDYGLGFKYFLADSVALRADARHIFSFHGGPNKTDSYWQNYMYTLGMTFQFGGGSPAPSAPPPAAPTSSLSVTPGSITRGESASLNWTSENATNCDINQGIGPVNPRGSMSVTPSADTTYSLSCNGPGGTSNSTANIAVAILPRALPAPTSSLKVTPLAISQGETATLDWTSENAEKCGIQPDIGPVKPQGTMTVAPVADTTYTLTCSGAGGMATSTANVGISVPLKPEPPSEMLCYNIEIKFDTGKWDIKPWYHKELEKLADFMKEYPQLTGVIEGHTDNVGGKAYNLKLSEKRAGSVRDYLVNTLGIDGSRLTAKGYGSSKPEIDNKTAAGRQINRRVIANFACVEKKRKK